MVMLEFDEDFTRYEDNEAVGGVGEGDDLRHVHKAKMRSSIDI